MHASRTRWLFLCLSILSCLSLPAFARAPGDDITGGFDPQHDPTRPTPDDGENAQLMLPMPDLALGPGLQLGGVQIPWGGSTTLSDQAAVSRSGGRCTFRYAYIAGNAGNVGSVPTVNRVFRDTQNGLLLSGMAMPGLMKGFAANVAGSIELPPGVWTLYVYVDAAATNAEFDEANNLRRVRVTVQGNCL